MVGSDQLRAEINHASIGERVVRIHASTHLGTAFEEDDLDILFLMAQGPSGHHAGESAADDGAPHDLRFGERRSEPPVELVVERTRHRLRA